jgi:hypothetical protein
MNKPFHLADYISELKMFKPGDKVLSAYRAKRMEPPQKRGFGKGQLVRDKHGKAIEVARLTI